MVKISAEQVLLLHKSIITSTGGLSGVRDYGLLEASVQSPFQTFDGIDLYKSDEEKAARLGYNLIANHPFFDGNKRIGILVFLTFLSLNYINVKFTDEELIEIGFSIASGTQNYNDLLKEIKKHKVENYKETNNQLEK